MSKKMKVNSLILDFDLYPRTEVDSQHVGYLVEALASGAMFPPIVIDAKTRKVTDGFHRCKAMLRFMGPEAEIDVIERTYPSEADMFLDAVQLNAHHGARLDRHDRVHCAIRALELKIPKKDLARVLNMPVDKFIELVKDRTAIFGKAETPVALKRTIEHMAGKKLTKGQEEANSKLGGMNPSFYVNQLIMLIENGLIDKENERLLERLEVLREVLGNFMAKR